MITTIKNNTHVITVTIHTQHINPYMRTIRKILLAIRYIKLINPPSERTDGNINDSRENAKELQKHLKYNAHIAINEQNTTKPSLIPGE